MHALHCDPIGGRAGGLGQRLAPLDVGFVEQSRPIDRADHDGLPGAQQHKANGFQRIVDHRGRLYPASAQRVP